MDTQRFDDIARSLATGSSRRTLLRGLLGGAAALAGLRAASTAAAPEEKVAICHFDADTGSYHSISVSGNALDAHIAHGDNSDIGCTEGYALNLDTCECVAVNECAGKEVGAPCAAGGLNTTCAELQPSGEMICVDTATGGPQDLGCASSAECDLPGEVCVFDQFTSGTDYHCHFPA